MADFIDAHKAATGLFVLLVMALYSAWDLPAAWAYLGMHGTYVRGCRLVLGAPRVLSQSRGVVG